VRVLNVYSKFLDVLEKILRVVLIVLLAAMVLIMFYQVIMRYVFSSSQPWCEELTLYLGVYSIFLGICIATRRDSHLQVDFLLNFYSPKIRSLTMAICSVIAIVVMILFCKYALSLMVVATGKSTTLPITMRQVYLVFPIGSVLMILYSIEGVAKNLIAFKNNGKYPELEGGSEK